MVAIRTEDAIVTNPQEDFRNFLVRNKINNKVAGAFFNRHPNYISNMKSGEYEITEDVIRSLQICLMIEAATSNSDELKSEVKKFFEIEE